MKAFMGRRIRLSEPLSPGGFSTPYEKEMVTHYSILAWKILWTKEPDGLQSMG